jgi:Na+:H+ antiporter, NhaC family
MTADASAGRKEIRFIHAALPILVLLLLVVFGLIIRPQFLSLPAFPLEVVFILASCFAVAEMAWLGFTWKEIESSVVRKMSDAMAAFFILFAIGVIVSSWMVSGTIPMLVFWGIEIIRPSLLYLFAFLVPIIFSTLTGTSWGSAGTIGVVLIGIAHAIGADLGITAGAIIGGAYFGDKMSPLSDTTNLAALAARVDLFDHIRSMTVTTLPSAILAAIGFFILGFMYPPAADGTALTSLIPFQDSLRAMFHFNALLLIPPLIVLVGSIRKMPTIPVLLVSVLAATVLAFWFQRFTLADILQSLNQGFSADMAFWMTSVPTRTAELVNRGGLYSMSQAIFVAFLVFFFIGTIDLIDAMPTVVNRVFSFASSRSSTILAALGATAFTNAMTSNQYATSFIVGDAFNSRFDMLRIPRKVLSRSLEDTGTMLESLVPWHTTSIFMVATLGVPWEQYWHWQLLSLINFVVAPMVAILGIGCFYHETDDETSAPDTRTLEETE